MSTYRLDQNQLPWLTPGTPCSRWRKEKRPLTQYMSLRSASAGGRAQDVCQCDSEVNLWNTRARPAVEGAAAWSTQQVKAYEANRSRSTPSLPQYGQQTRSSASSGRGSLATGMSGSRASINRARTPGLDSTSDDMYRATTSRASSTTSGYASQADLAASAAKLNASASEVLPSSSTSMLRSSMRKERPVASGGRNVRVAFAADSISSTSTDTLGSLVDYEVSGDSSSSLSLTDLRGRASSSSLSGRQPTRLSVDAPPADVLVGDSNRHVRQSRPVSAAAYQQALQQQTKTRPHSAFAASPSYHATRNADNSSSLAVQGYGPSVADPSRQQSLVRLQRGPAEPRQAPHIAWMGLAQRAHLHERPTSSKPKRPPSATGKRKRISSAPPRMHTGMMPTEEMLTLTELVDTDPAPPSSPVTLEREVKDSSMDDTLFERIELTSQPAEDASMGYLEEEELMVEDVEEELVDEGYVDDTEAEPMAEDVIKPLESPKPTEPEPPQEDEATTKKSLKKAKFGAKKKQGLTDDTDTLNEYMRNRHRIKASHDADDGSGQELTKDEPEWMKAKLMPSLQSCRFELPVVLTMLDGMPPSDYLSNYCIIISRRQKWYNKAFNSIDRLRQGQLDLKEVKKALALIHMDALRSPDLDQILEICELRGEASVGRQLFHGIAALSERILAAKLRDQGFAILPRELIEKADFSAIDFKLEGVKVRASLRDLLTHIMVD